MTATVFNSATDLYNHTIKMNERLVVTSGGFDPLHVGHLRCIIESAEIARKSGIRVRLAVIVNGDGFLLRKKSYAFMPENETSPKVANEIMIASDSPTSPTRLATNAFLAAVA